MLNLVEIGESTSKRRQLKEYKTLEDSKSDKKFYFSKYVYFNSDTTAVAIELVSTYVHC